MPFEVDYASAEREGCSSKIVLDDRIFYVRLLSSSSGAKYFSGEQDGSLQKEISKAEFELWVNILADEADVKTILEKVSLGRKY